MTMNDPDVRLGDIIKDFELTEYLGKGAYGHVYKARLTTTGEYVAVKTINKKEAEEKQRRNKISNYVQQEIEIHSELDHPSILKLHEYFEDENYYYLVLELCHIGDLQKYLKRKGEPFSEDYARHIFRQVVEGMIYLHSKQILHRDIKPSNLLLTSDMNVKIADFGMATRLTNENDKHLTMCGTPNFISPEVVKHRPYGLEADVWSLGCLLYTLAVGNPPFSSSATVRSTLADVARANFKIPSHLSSDLKDLLQLLLNKDQKRRIKIHDILRHPFMNPIREKLTYHRSVDSGLGSLSTSSVSVSSSKRSFDMDTRGRAKFHKDPNIYCDNSAEQSRPKFGKGSQPVISALTAQNQKVPSMNAALKAKIHGLPLPLKANFSEQQFENENLPHCVSDNNGRERDVSEERRRLQMMRDNCHLSAGDCHDYNSRSERCDDSRCIKSCRSVSPHGSHGTCDSGILDKKSCHNHYGESCPERELCSKYNRLCCSDSRKDNSCHHHCPSPAHSCHGSRDELDCCGLSQKDSSCSHFGHCDVAHCVHKEICSCRKTSFVNHSNCPSECQQKCQKSYLSHSNSCEVLRDERSQNISVQTNQVSPPLPSNAWNSNMFIEKPSSFNTKNLKPRRNTYKTFVASILETGEVCLEFFVKHKQDLKVITMCLISSDGLKIKVYKPGHKGIKLKDEPPSILESSSHQVYYYENLPREVWNKYLRASKYVRNVKSITPRVTLYSPQAKAVLMESMNDYEATFYKGGKFQKHLEKVTFIDFNGRTIEIGPNQRIENLGNTVVDMWTHALECEEDCRNISALLEKGSGRNSFFPVFVGSRPSKSLPLKNSNKENINILTVSNSTSNARQYDNTATTNSVHHSQDVSQSQENHSWKQNSSKNVKHSENVLDKHQTRNSQKSSKILKKVANGKGQFLLLGDGTSVAEFADGSKMVFPANSNSFQFSDLQGQRSYGTSSYLPAHITEKLEEFQMINKKHFHDVLTNPATNCYSLLRGS